MLLNEFRLVRARIRPYLRSTPVVSTETPGLLLKLENLQHTHSFKVRGAYARVLELVASGDRRTVLAVSAGNHGQAVARATREFGLRCVVVVPKSAPKTKVDAIRNYRADLWFRGENYDEAEAETLQLARTQPDQYAFISPYNDPLVILGQGSLAFEILEQAPQVQTIVAPVGGGGLIAGVALAAKQLKSSIRIIGVQAEASAAIYASLKAGKMVTVPDRPSIADGIHGNLDPDTITLALIQEQVDDVVLVSEDEIRDGIRELLFREKILAEGSAAAAYAAVTTGKVNTDSTVVALISGGNIDESIVGLLVKGSQN